MRTIALALMLTSAISSFAADAPQAPRAARSVHLGYIAPPATEFYNELSVEQSVPGSYFMACGFSRGYFGIQELGNGKKVAIFSVWDPTSGDRPDAVPEDRRVQVLHQADDVQVRRFGGEGTGGQSFFDFDWKKGETCRFLVRAKVENELTAYAAYLFVPGASQWKHLVTFQVQSGGDPLKGLYSFIEDFRRDGRSAQQSRRAWFGNGWVRDMQGEWQPLLKARFTASSATWEAKETIDAGLVGDRFYLQTGGDTTTSNPLRTILQRPAKAGQPPSDLPQN